jgi:hypothetical protein
MCARHHRIAICMANESFELVPPWLEEVLAIISLKAPFPRAGQRIRCYTFTTVCVIVQRNSEDESDVGICEYMSKGRELELTN